MTQSISIGPAVTLVNGIAYALPARGSFITTNLGVETSLDGTNWTFLAGSLTGVNTGAIFIRSISPGTVVVCRPTVSGSSSGGGGGDTFDQSLNTTDSVAFDEIDASVVVSDNLVLDGGSITAVPGYGIAIGTSTINLTSQGENIYIIGEGSSVDDGGDVIIEGGIAGGDSSGGQVTLRGGSATVGSGGDILINAGGGTSGNTNGVVIISTESPANGADPGDISINAVGGRIQAFGDEINLNPISRFSMNDLDGFTGTITSASLTGKTITITNGIITGFA